MENRIKKKVKTGSRKKILKNASAATNKEEKTIIRFKTAVVTARSLACIIDNLQYLNFRSQIQNIKATDQKETLNCFDISFQNSETKTGHHFR